MRHIRFEVTNRLVEDLRRLRCFWGEEFERKRGRIRPHNVGDVHDSVPTFAPAATFGQLTEATHGTITNTRAGKRHPG